MENRKKRNIGGTILLVAAGAALTVVGFMFIPPLIQKYGNKAYNRNIQKLSHISAGQNLTPALRILASAT